MPNIAPIGRLWCIQISPQHWQTFSDLLNAVHARSSCTSLLLLHQWSNEHLLVLKTLIRITCMWRFPLFFCSPQPKFGWDRQNVCCQPIKWGSDVAWQNHTNDFRRVAFWRFLDIPSHYQQGSWWSLPGQACHGWKVSGEWPRYELKQFTNCTKKTRGNLQTNTWLLCRRMQFSTKFRVSRKLRKSSD